MPEWITIQQATRRYAISDKTIRNWIKAGSLHPERIMVAGRFQYAIDAHEIERVIAEHNTGSLKQLLAATSTDARIADLERRVQALERAMQERTIPPPHDATLAPSQPVQKRPYTHRATRADVPPDAITLAQLARELDVVPHTLLDHVKNHGLEHIAVFKRQRGDVEEYERFFTVEQAEKVKVWHAQFRRK